MTELEEWKEILEGLLKDAAELDLRILGVQRKIIELQNPVGPTLEGFLRLSCESSE
jgi:hypothetical protein